MKKETKQKIKEILKKVVMFILNPRLLLCFGIAWMITNGWSYVMLALGAYFKISWMTALAAGYLALMWVPGTPEKIITVACRAGQGASSIGLRPSLVLSSHCYHCRFSLYLLQ